MATKAFQEGNDLLKTLPSTTGACRDDAVRNITTAFLPLVYSTVKCIAQRFPWVDQGDMASVGCIGLRQSIERFDPTKRVLFTTFAHHRILGAIQDHIRDSNDIPRLMRESRHAITQLNQQYYAKHGRLPTDTEILSL